MLADVIVKVAGMEREERHAYYPRPSLAGPERCIRQLVYWGNGTPADKEIADRFIMVLDDSSWHEQLTIDWIQKTAYQIHSQQMEVSVSGHGINLIGHIDGVVTDLLGIDRLFEHKAINHFSWQKYAKGTPPLDNITQSCIYIKGLQAVNPDINETVLLMKNKNTAQYLEFIIGYDSSTDTATIKSISISYGEVSPIGEVFENVVDGALLKFAKVDEHITAGTLPDRPFEFGTEFPCGYCSWQETCWANYEQEVKALSQSEADLNDMADAARFYKELGAQIDDMKGQQDEIKKSITARLHELEARHGKAGEYEIKLILTNRKGYTVADTMYDQLKINKFKPKGGKKK